MRSSSILILGLFVNEKNKNTILRTASDQLAELLIKNGYQVIKSAFAANRIIRLLHNILYCTIYSGKYSIAIVPFYSSYKSFVLEFIQIHLLKLFNKKIIVVVHGGNIPNRMAKKTDQYKNLLSKATALVAPSNFLLSNLNTYGLYGTVIPNVLNFSDYTFHKKTVIQPSILWMRTFEDVYNPLMAVDVLVHVKKQFPNATLTMAGKDDGLLEATKQYAIQEKVFNNIHFAGLINNKQKNELAATCDIYICTNNIDNAPVSIIEMMRLGLLIVSTNAGGIPFIATHNKNAILVNCNDGVAMANAIIHAINNPTEALQLIEEAVKTSEKYGESIVIEQWKHLFNALSNK